MIEDESFVKKEIDFGYSLLDIGRTPSEVRRTMKARVDDPLMREYILKMVFERHVDAQNVLKKSRNVPIETIRLNRYRLNYLYSIKNLLRIPLILAVIGAIVLFLSNSKVNGNAIYGISTIVQACFLVTIGYYLKLKNKHQLLLYFFVGFSGLFLIELLLFGLPNDLVAGYKNVNIRTHDRINKITAVGGARFIGMIFPYLYLFIKLGVVYLVFRSYYNWYEYDRLPESTKNALEELK